MRTQTRNLLLTIRYQGTAYHGFQVQKNALTVAQVLQDALEAVLGRREDIKGCSRTDSGVHANMFCVSVRTESAIPCQSLVRALNVKLPCDIAVTDCRQVPDDFHARYSCTGKRYLYQINNSPVKDPFRWKQVYDYRYPIDVAMCDRQCKDFIGTHDFSSLCSAGSSVGTMCAPSPPANGAGRGPGHLLCGGRRLFVQHGPHHGGNDSGDCSRQQAAGLHPADSGAARPRGSRFYRTGMGIVSGPGVL